MTFHDNSLLSRHFLWLKALSAIYVIAIPASHAALSKAWVWEIAVFFLIAMQFTYPWAAWRQRSGLPTEMSVSVGLATLGMIGLWVWPGLIVFAIFGHGVWDLAKYKGCGTLFFGWYVRGCVVIDWLYAAVLALHMAR